MSDPAADTLPPGVSRTALGTLYLRAAHMLLEAAPHVLDDPVAVTLVGDAGRARIRDHADEYQTQGLRALRAHVVLRSRVAEDRLRDAAARGVKRCVVLGAGFDTFGYRQPAWARGIEIVEIDTPATQAFKARLLAARGVAVPDNVRLCATDFEREALADGLRRHGLGSGVATFFSWLGVTMYLTRETVASVLAAIAAFPSGSEIVLTFAPVRDREYSRLEQRVAELGEPWRSRFAPQEMAATLRTAGFTSVGFLDETAAAHYFAHRPSDLDPPASVSIAFATR